MQLVSNVSLTYVGQKLTREVRVVLFGAMLQQEIGWYAAVIWSSYFNCCVLPPTMVPLLLLTH